ncbi:PAS domain S-box protein [bacterium]|nr:PAS domain S-box protein [bacterium]
MDKATRNAFRLAVIIPLFGMVMMSVAHVVTGWLLPELPSLPLPYLLVHSALFVLLAILVFFLSRAGQRIRDRAESSLQTTRENIDDLFEQASLAQMSLDEQGIVLSVNHHWETLTGYSASEIEGVRFASLLVRPFSNEFDEIFAEYREAGRINGLLVELLQKSHTPLLIELYGRRYKKNDEPAYYQCLVRDISERTRDSLALMIRSSWYKTLFEKANDAIFVMEKNIIVDCNEKSLELFDISRTELMGMRPSDLSPEFQKDNVRSADREARLLTELEQKRSLFFNWLHQTRTGQVFHAEVSLTCVPNQDHTILAIVRDISDRVQSQRAMNELEERFRLAFETSPDAININRLADGKYVAINEGFRKLSGYTDEEVLGKTSLDLNIWDNPSDRDRMVESLSRTGEVQNLEANFALKDGSIHTGLMSAKTVMLDGEPHIISITRVIDEVKAAEQALRESEKKYRMLIDNSLDGIYILQMNNIIFCNRVQASMLGYDSPGELIGHSIDKVVSPRSMPIVLENLKQRELGEVDVMRYEVFMLKKDGSELEVEVYGSRVEFEGRPAIQGVMRDISERKRLQRQLDQASRLESVGRLAGGVAHDFNNLLTAIVGHAELGLFQLKEEHPFRRDLEEILAISQRGANLTRHLLAFSKERMHQPKTISLRELILELERMLHRVIGEDIHMVLALEKEDWAVRVDPGQVDQAIVNLSINARDAMPTGGTLTIHLENRAVDNASCYFHTGTFSGDHVILEVRDTGIGMDHQTLQKVFDPFFTTKPTGKGTGLGLSTVYGVVRNAGGHLQVESTPGEGTAFRLFFPRSQTAVEQGQEAESTPIPVRGSERILLVEDDIAVRNTLIKAIRAYGYTVDAVESGKEALDWLEGTDDHPDLMITDVVMPELRGTELAEIVLKKWPTLPMLFISGYREPLEDGKIIELGIPFLQKPFTAKELLQLVRSILDDPTDS